MSLRILLLSWLPAAMCAGASFADEPAYRGLARAPAFDEPYSFNSEYAPGALISIGAADASGERELAIHGCGSEHQRTLRLRFTAMGALFVVFENSDNRQLAGSCDIYLNLYFTAQRGLTDQITAEDVVIWCESGECQRID